MAKFCGNCGAPLDDGAKVCGQCGTPVEGNGSKALSFKVDDPEKKKNLMKRVKTIAVLAVVVIVAIVGIRIALSFTGTNGMVRKVMAAYKDYDIDALVAISSDIYYYSNYENYVDEYFEYAVGNVIDGFESSVGHNYSFSYEVEEIYDLSQRRQDEMTKNIEYSYPDFDIETISKIAVAEVKVTAKQGSKLSSRTIRITMSQESGGWKLLYLE